MCFVHLNKLREQVFRSLAKLFNCKSDIFVRAAELCIVTVNEYGGNVFRMFVMCRKMVNNQRARITLVGVRQLYYTIQGKRGKRWDTYTRMVFPEPAVIS